MNRSRLLPLLAFAAMLQSLACLAQGAGPAKPAQPAKTAAPRYQWLIITSQLTGKLASGGKVQLTLSSVAVYTETDLKVLFSEMYMVAENPGDLGPLTVTLNRGRQSAGTLESRRRMAEHRQDFYLRIRSEKLGTLVSRDPLTLSARIESLPPTATYKSVSKDVQFYQEDDRDHKPVLTVQQVTADMKPASQQVIRLQSRITATVAGKKVEIQALGLASYILTGRRVFFTSNSFSPVDAPPEIGVFTASLNGDRVSAGTLAAATFPTEHRQDFFLLIVSKRFDRLVNDDPLTLSATIGHSPPTGTTYKLVKPVTFYQRGDKSRKPVLTFEAVESTVRP